MDSVNLSETRSNPLNYASTASNTSPAPCACCGLKNYAQTVPQAYYFRALYPGLSKCKQCQGDAEEKFPLQQQFFAGLPSFFPPFFYNNAIPSNSCCSEHHLSEAAASGQQPACGLRMNKTATEEVKKNNSTFEEQCLGNPVFIPNSTDTQLNSFLHRCGCGDSTSWPYSPFILPVISYCVLWNSQKTSMGILSGNYSGISPETLCQKNNVNPENQKHSRSDADREIPSRNLDKDLNNNSTETAGCEEEKCLRVTAVTRNGWEKEGQLHVEQNDANCLRSSVFNSSNFSTESTFKSAEQMDDDDDNTRYIVTGSDDVRMEKDEEYENEEEKEDMETQDSAGHETSDESLKLDEKDLPNLTNLYFSNEPHNTSLNENESQPSSASESQINLKEAGKSAESATDFSSSDTEANPSDISAEGEKAFHSRISNHNIQEKISDNECKRKTPEMTATHLNKPISIKKFIKNFTMTDNTNSVHEEAQNSATAAGDLGGDNCVGYKVNILSFEEDQQYKILQETQTDENFHSKAFLMKGSSDLRHQSESYSEKSMVKNSKSPRSFKSGIAKLSQNSKLKESKGDAIKKIRNCNKELSLKEPPVIKRKHSCFPNDNTAGIYDCGSKIQKTKNCGVVQQQTQGPETQCRTTSNGSEPLKKAEKILKVKTQADKTNSQKLSKSTRKK